MHWTKINDYYIESNAGYRITKGRDISMEKLTYVAHAPDGKHFAFVPSAKEATKACDDHFENRSKK